MVKKIGSNEFAQEVAEGVSVVDFSAEWCGPCKMLAPVLEEISAEYEGRIKFFNVDVDENGSLAQKYGIMNIPAIVVLKDGVKQDMHVGFVPKPVLNEFLDKQI
ncbi:MAG: thioredoxin [Lachnospira sp.]